LPAATVTGLLAEWGIAADLGRWLAVAFVAGGLAAFAFLHRGFRTSPGQIVAGLLIGLTIASGWYVTGRLGDDFFDPVPLASLTFIAPVASSVQYLMLSTGMALNFGIAVVGGVLAGGLVTALALRQFHWEGFTAPRTMLRYAGGGAFMG